MLIAEQKPFGKIRNFFWPIYNHELKKLIPMFTLFFLITFIYNLLRPMKLSLMVNAEGSGAEVIPFLKVWAVLPGAFLMTYIFTLLANRLNREQIFYSMLFIFLGFFTFFLLVLYPNRQSLELTQFSNFCAHYLPEGFRGLAEVIRHWPLSLFYVLAEIWSTIVLSMLFWGFANEVTTVDEAKRFYAIFALGANSSGIFSGQLAQMLNLNTYKAWIPYGVTAWDQSVFLGIMAALICGALVLIIFYWLNHAVIKDQNAEVVNPHLASAVITKKPKLTLRECFSYLAKSSYMIYLTIIVVAYNIVYNLSDVLFTHEVKLKFPDITSFSNYMNHIISITGIFAVLSALIISGNVIRRFGWTVAALITPVIWLVTSIGFFFCLLFDNTGLTSIFYSILHVNFPVTSLIIFFGSAQMCLGRASKYTVFDETKEIVFIPLSRENKRKGKAVIDGIASRFGKSGGSVMYQVLLVTFGELALTIPYVAAIITLVVICWIIAVRKLGRLVNRSIDQEIKDNSDPSFNKKVGTQLV
ncbi:MAG: carrier protein [Francisellaceae bacterium]|nr:carrier protein [Francisellaceae bacterium]